MHRYESDIVAWANEQAALLRAGQFNMLDLEPIADEIEDVGKSERRELRSRMAVLLAHLLKWQYQEGFRSKSRQRTIKAQRRGIASCLKETPSLETDLTQPDWWEWVWSDAAGLAVKETGLDCFPESCPWDF
ncbi:DUF29 domain-containing protein [Methylotuvimicrobium sp. KM2]|uniref:DUF29 domain-containing protein n=1 Tax=Methylotuvimicrobium sp. KM2 TaxID=3133976 RepID=UPI0031012684